MEYMVNTFLGKEVVENLGSYGDGANRTSKVLDVNPQGIVLECTKIGYRDAKIEVGTVRFIPWNAAHFALRDTTKV